MGTRVRSHAKINLGLAIGPVRPDGFHGLVTLYQTLALHDHVTVTARQAAETTLVLTTTHPRVPCDARNTAWRMVAGALDQMGLAAEVAIHIEKRLPVQGGMGAGSANAAAALIALERELGVVLPEGERLALAAGVGSDVPLFLVGGAVLGTGRGEVVEAMTPDLPGTACVVALPHVGISTPQAFRDWDQLTSERDRDTLSELSRVYASTWVNPEDAKRERSGIVRGQVLANGLAENPLLALVRTGIENDFESVVFLQHPSLREIKRQLLGLETSSPAWYAALSGSGSALFGLYGSMAEARSAQQRVQASGCRALVTETLPRREYWRRMIAE